MSDYYNRDGTKVEGGVFEWAKKLEKEEDRRVARDVLPDGKIVSTVFLGLDHNFSEKGAPLIFETMVFPNKGDASELECERYSTEQEALEGHKKIKEKYLKGGDKE